MQTKDAIKYSLGMGDMITQAYLGDMTDDELMQRAVPGINHICWQLGHLIQAEHQMVEMVCPNSMPKLPEGFAEQHSKEASSSDDPSKFLKKADYLKLAAEQRAGTITALDALSDAELDKPAPERLHEICKTVGEIFAMQGQHWTMHTGQWAVLRRKLGRPPLF
ncbi:MAG: DinB family protein [Planctomycetota bacterium]|nr:DinB family protein [Planctomycetota bacterium]MDA1211334.1 DinB family protein [Planctomycetota bacterium]